MSTRLTQNLKLALVSALVTHRLEKERKAQKTRDNAFALSVYLAAYPAKVRKQMEDLPEGWLPVSSTLKFTIGVNTYAVDLANVVRIQACDCHAVLAKFKNDSSVAERWKEVNEKRQALSAQEKELRNKARETLAGFSTVAALVKGWPEIEPFLAKVGASVQTTKLPAIVPAELNKRFDLPV